VSNGATRIGSGEHGDDRGDPQFGQSVCMRGVVARQVDREPGLDGRSDQAPVLDSDSIVAEDRLWVKAITFLPVLAATKLSEERAVDLRAISRQVARLSVAPQTARAERSDFCAEFRPGATGKTAGYAIPMQAECAGFSIAAVLIQSAARPA
jgi:hypothetical protein